MMKWVAGIVAGAALALGGSVHASTSGTIYIQNGIWCKTASGGIVCVRQTGTGYAVGFSRNAVMVMRFDGDGSSHTVFKRYQP